MSLLDIKDLSHSFGEKQLFKEAEFQLNEGEHIGIVGPNGAGKSTFIKICTGQVIPDNGQVVRHPAASFGCLDQYAQMEQNITISDFLKSAFQSLYIKEEQMNLLYSKAAVGLGLLSIGLERQVEEISGGQRARAILAKLLLEQPSVLLLDEPTNFLDKEHVSWLADYLSGLPNAFMVVSHDHDFLERSVSRICDIHSGRLTKYYGSYSEFLKKKTFLQEEYMRQYTSQQKKIKETEEFIRKNMAGRKSKMARGRKKQLDRMERMENPDVTENCPCFNFSQLPVTNADHLSVRHLSVGYQYPLLSGLQFSAKGGQKMVITGFNGIGKSTLLKTLTNQIPALDGSFSFSEQVTIG